MLVYFAVILPVLLGFCGLAIDLGRIELRTNQLQAAADAGALAAAGELMHSSNTGSAGNAAYYDVVQVATANGIPAPSLTGQLGSTFSFYIADNSVVEIQLTQSVPTIFIGLVTHASTSMTVSVKADAQVPPCTLFMGNPALNHDGGGNDFWNASSSMNSPIGCPSYFKDGVGIDGFANVAGSQVRTSGPASYSTVSGWVSYPAIYNAPVIADPLTYITAPTPGTCSNFFPIVRTYQPSSTTISLTPGTYCGATLPYVGTSLCNVSAYLTTPAIDIQGAQVVPFGGVGCPNQNATNGGNCLTTPTVNFAPGLYVIVGGMNLNCVIATGSGVTLFFTKNSSVGFGRFSMISSTWNVSAPTTTTGGALAGIVVMNDRNWTPSFIGAKQDFDWTYGTYNADGVIYLTKTGLDAYALRMSAPNYLNFVVANLYNYLAPIYPSNNYANLPAGNPLRLYPTLVQ